MNTIKLFYKLGNGIAYNHQVKVVTFLSRESALEFKHTFPTWHSQYSTLKMLDKVSKL